MLGSHNSFTYLTPVKWWMRLLTPWTKCQSKTIVEQYEAGVRYFDIRVSFDKRGNIRLVHNKVQYPPAQLFEGLRMLNNKPGVYVRVILDVRKKPSSTKYTTQMIEWFYDFLYYIIKHTTITIDKAIVFWNWKHIIDNGAATTEQHASVCAKWYEYICGIEYWSEMHNGTILSSNAKTIDSDNDVLLIDYI